MQVEGVTDKSRIVHLVLNEKGETVGRYQKVHLFDVDIPGRVRVNENDFAVAGNRFVPPVPTPVGNVGLSVVCRLPSVILVVNKTASRETEIQVMKRNVLRKITLQWEWSIDSSRVDTVIIVLLFLNLNLILCLYLLNCVQCYDLRFAELSGWLRSQGAHILTYPSAFTVPTGMAHWEVSFTTDINN